MRLVRQNSVRRTGANFSNAPGHVDSIQLFAKPRSVTNSLSQWSDDADSDFNSDLDDITVGSFPSTTSSTATVITPTLRPKEPSPAAAAPSTRPVVTVRDARDDDSMSTTSSPHGSGSFRRRSSVPLAADGQPRDAGDDDDEAWDSFVPTNEKIVLPSKTTAAAAPAAAASTSPAAPAKVSRSNWRKFAEEEEEEDDFSDLVVSDEVFKEKLQVRGQFYY